MGSLFGGSPRMPQPDPEIKEAQDRQAAQLEADEIAKRKALAARQRASRRGGMRMLLSTEREDAQTGIDGQETLGA